MFIPLIIFVILLIFIFMGVPVSFSIGLTSLVSIYMFDLGVPLTIIPSHIFSGINSFSLMAIPFFIFGGEIMNKAGITRRIIDLADSIVGWMKGGLSQVNIVASMLMAGISGSGTADVAALAPILIPSMEEQGYSKEYAIAITSCSDVVGPIIPPSTLFILFAYYTNTSVASLFLGGVIPGILMGLALMVVGHFICKKHGFRQENEKFTLKKLVWGIRRGWIALLIPVFLLVSLVKGWATPSEAGVLMIALAIIFGLFFKTIRSFKDIKDCVINAAFSTSTIFALIAISGIFSNVLIRINFQNIIVDIIGTVAQTPNSALLLIILFIFILGMVIDVTPMIIMFSAALTNVAHMYGISSIFFGVIFVSICMVGAVTPPVGGILFITTAIGKSSMFEVIPMLIPFLIAIIAVIILVILIPSLATALPVIFG